MNKLPLEPNITMGDSFMFSLKAWARNVASAFNAAVDGITANTADIATKAPIASPTFTGDPKAPTPANSDNDTSIATTAWVNSAMATIATAAGFAFSFGTTSYLKLPSWLGSWVVQWGNSTGTTGAGSSINVSFPLTFPTACRAAVVSSSSGASTLGLPFASSRSATGFSAVFVQGTGSGNGGVGSGISVACDWIAVGN